MDCGLELDRKKSPDIPEPLLQRLTIACISLI